MVDNLIARTAKEDQISRDLDAVAKDDSTPESQAKVATQHLDQQRNSKILTRATEATSNQGKQAALLSGQTDGPELLGKICYQKLRPENWQPVEWLPAAINARIKALADMRCHNHELHDVQDHPMTKQSIADTDVSIDGTKDMIAYAPRGLQLGFFAPLPSQWPSDSFFSSFFYTVVPIMMVYFYIAIFFGVMWTAKNKAWLALPLFTISLVPIWILGISASFLGSLFRYRYPIWMILFCFCTAALLTILFSKKSGGSPSEA